MEEAGNEIKPIIVIKIKEVTYKIKVELVRRKRGQSTGKDNMEERWATKIWVEF